VDLEKTQTRVILADLAPGESGIIDEIALPADMQQFLLRFGLFPGVEVRLSRRAPFGDPSAYWIDGSEIALRSDTTRQIFVIQNQPTRDEVLS
jgi:ferrous iron transport protein A